MAIKMKSDDLLPPVEATLKEANGTAIDLSTYNSVNFTMENESGSVVVNAAATIVDATNGEVRYEWQSGDTDAPGVYKAEFVLTDPNGNELTIPSEDYIDVHIERSTGDTT